MPRVLPVADGEVPEFDVLLEETRRSGRQVANLQRMVGRSPEVLRGWGAFSDAVRFSTSLTRAQSELVILRVSLNSRCRYSFAHHVPMALEHGLTPEQLHRLPDWEQASCFDEVQRALLAAVDAAVQRHGVDDAAFQGLLRSFPEKAAVEVVTLIAFYVSLACIANSLDAEVDERVAPVLAEYWPPDGQLAT